MISTPSPIIIVGAGPAGLFAAETLAQAGLPVALYDRLPSPGRKFLLAGRGGLNLTHSEPHQAFLPRYGEAAPVLAPLLESFTPKALSAWAGSLGEPTFIGSSGRIFPKSFKATSLLRAWLGRLSALGVELHPRHTLVALGRDGSARFDTPNGEVPTPPGLILLALGGASWPRMGSNGAWVELLAPLGVPIAPLRPANSGFDIAWSPAFAARNQGQPLKRIALTLGDQTVHGEAIVTSHGLEGGVVYAIAARLRDTITRSGPTTLMLDLRPDLSVDALSVRLAKGRAGDSLANRLRKIGLAGAAIGLMREAHGVVPSAPSELAQAIKAVPLTVTGTRPIARAISTAGGVMLDAIAEDQSLKAAPDIFVAGEMTDWEAPTGGYLLQATFATGFAAARGLAARRGVLISQPENTDW